MVKTTKTWTSWVRNITFLRNKNILNLCLRWHISRSYRFLVEATINAWGIFKTMSNIYGDEAYWEPWYSQNNLLRHFQAYSGTFSNIHPCPGISRKIKAYWGIFKHYLGILSHIQKIFRPLCVTLTYTTVPYSELWRM